MPDEMKLERFCYSPMGTFGRLRIGDLEWYTVEQPWWWEPDNPAGVPFKSCVPEGEYTVMRTSTPHHEQAFILDSQENWVFHAKQDEYSRYGILIHVGNTIHDVVGCIAPGKELGVVNVDGTNLWAVLRSRDAFTQLWAVEADEFELTITQVQGADSGGPL